MKIIRTINNNEIEIELSHDEIYEAHKEFLLEFFVNTVNEILNDTYAIDNTDNKALKEIANDAYYIYSEGNGDTEYEACEKAVDEYVNNIGED